MLRVPYWVAGVDEVGRGPLAGAVIAAAVILNPDKPIKGLKDSKLLTKEKREALYILIQEQALSYSIGRAEVEEIDTLNILHATMKAMQRAVLGLNKLPHLVMIDGNRCPEGLPCPSQALIRGDQLEPAISAASIIAKVTRDREMVLLDEAFPLYGFASHKGYATEMHLAALKKYGPCKLHRRFFAPVVEARKEFESA